MALFSECMPSCARKVLDTADIVREAILRKLRWKLMSSSHGLQVKILANSPLCFRLKGSPATTSTARLLASRRTCVHSPPKAKVLQRGNRPSALGV
jgi:hypothetical protein